MKMESQFKIHINQTYEINAEDKEQAFKKFQEKVVISDVAINQIYRICGKEVEPLHNIEKSSSGRAGCWYCHKKIGLNNPRGIILINTYKGYLTKYYVCFNCLEKYNLTDEQRKCLDKLKEECKNDIMLTKLEE